MLDYKSSSGKCLFTIEKKRVPKSFISKGVAFGMYRIYYLISGRIDCFIKDKCYRMRGGELVLINMHTLSRNIYNDEDASERILLKLDQAFFEDLCSETGIDDLIAFFKADNTAFRLRQKSRRRIEEILLNILEEFKADDTSSKVMIKNLLTEFLILLTREVNSQTREGMTSSETVKAKAAEIVQYINTNYMLDLPLKSLAEKFFISPYYMIKIFKRYTGFTVTEYINNVRIQEAARLLRCKGAKVADTAEKVGFSNATNFSRVFKRIMHISPAKYRVSLTRKRSYTLSTSANP
ncbi:MAG: AraC family transcriptional regulator [bacterium]|nr:AraC family transcriptional regulator [bacterium]